MHKKYKIMYIPDNETNRNILAIVSIAGVLYAAIAIQLLKKNEKIEIYLNTSL